MSEQPTRLEPDDTRFTDAKPAEAEDVAPTVAAMLARFRAEILAGRGPGASEDELARHTTDRPTVGGRSTAVSREMLHVRTARHRGAERAAVDRELDWARPWAGHPPDSGTAAVGHDPNTAGHRLLRCITWLAVAARLLARRR